MQENQQGNESNQEYQMSYVNSRKLEGRFVKFFKERPIRLQSTRDKSVLFSKVLMFHIIQIVLLVLFFNMAKPRSGVSQGDTEGGSMRHFHQELNGHYQGESTDSTESGNSGGSVDSQKVNSPIISALKSGYVWFHSILDQVLKYFSYLIGEECMTDLKTSFLLCLAFIALCYYRRTSVGYSDLIFKKSRQLVNSQTLVWVKIPILLLIVCVTPESDTILTYIFIQILACLLFVSAFLSYIKQDYSQFYLQLSSVIVNLAVNQIVQKFYFKSDLNWTQTIYTCNLTQIFCSGLIYCIDDLIFDTKYTTQINSRNLIGCALESEIEFWSIFFTPIVEIMILLRKILLICFKSHENKFNWIICLDSSEQMGKTNFQQVKGNIYNFLMQIDDFHRRTNGESILNLVNYSYQSQVVLRSEKTLNPLSLDKQLEYKGGYVDKYSLFESIMNTINTEYTNIILIFTNSCNYNDTLKNKDLFNYFSTHQESLEVFCFFDRKNSQVHEIFPKIKSLSEDLPFDHLKDIFDLQFILNKI